MKGPVAGALEHLALDLDIASITLIKDSLLYGDDTRVSVSPMKAMIESDFLFF